MIIEHAILDVKPEDTQAYEAALREAVPFMAATTGFIRMEVRPCLEQAGRYLLRVEWETLSAHTEVFRGSENYKRWSGLLHKFYVPFPTVEHYGDPVVSR